MHQNQETEKPGDPICTIEREMKGGGRSQEAFPSLELGCDGPGQCLGSLPSPSSDID